MIAVTGAIDLVSDAERTFVIRNGRPMMGRVTGTGCMLSAMTAAYLAANPECRWKRQLPQWAQWRLRGDRAGAVTEGGGQFHLPQPIDRRD